MSDVSGIRNFAGSDAISASRSSFGKAKPISASSRENARYTIRPTRNLTRSRTRTSWERGSVEASSLTAPIVVTAVPRMLASGGGLGDDLGAGHGRRDAGPGRGDVLVGTFGESRRARRRARPRPRVAAVAGAVPPRGHDAEDPGGRRPHGA